jgi:hypothetical protein
MHGVGNTSIKKDTVDHIKGQLLRESFLSPHLLEDEWFGRISISAPSGCT